MYRLVHWSAVASGTAMACPQKPRQNRSIAELDVVLGELLGSRLPLVGTSVWGRLSHGHGLMTPSEGWATRHRYGG